MRGRLGELRMAPWTLWAYAGLSVASTAVAAFRMDPALLWSLPIAFGFQLLLDYFLLHGSRLVWWVLLVLFELGAIPFYVTGDTPLWQAPITLAGLLLLLAPPSRRYVFRPRPRRQKLVAAAGTEALGPQTSWDAGDQDDAMRPPGWYFDPDDPSRMLYWHPGLGGWQSKTTRAPRKLRRHAGEAAVD